MEQIEASKPVSVDVNLSHHLATHAVYLEMVSSGDGLDGLGFILFRGSCFVLFGAFLFHLFVGFFLGGWSFLDRKQFEKLRKE